LEIPGLFGEWLKQRRKALDLTQDELAERAGCSVFALRKIESGERRPSKQLAGLLAAALEIPEEEQQTFIRVARGDLNLGRLRTNASDTSLPSISDFLTQYRTQESASHLADDPTRLDTSLEPVHHHLPLPPTPLLGRDSELAAIERLFKDSQCRLLTLTGMGGIGKTRLAIEFASRQRDSFPAGVHYVPLASVNSTESIIPAVAAALEFSFSGPANLTEQLINYMSVKMKRSALLILDNLEHLIVQSSDTVDLVSELIRRLPELKILSTSRERLNLQGEWMYELHGLPVPPVEFEDNLDDYSSAILFLQRSRQINPDFTINDSEKSDLIRICRLVDGVPLAIELAAAWMGMLTCNEIAREIESNVDFLSTSMRDMPERHRSLRATFDHSWKLLSDHERDVLSRLSVFHGGFDRSAAEKIAGASLSLLASLVSKSLVRRIDGGGYDLHEVIRQYASSHLEEDESRCTETCGRHSKHYLNFVAEYERKLKSAHQQEAVREMTDEMDNIRIAWDWGVRHGKFELLGRAIRSLGWFYEVAGLHYEGMDQLEHLIKAIKKGSGDIQMDRVLGIALTHQGLLYFRIGQFVHAQELYGESIKLLRSANEQTVLADALIFSGTLKHLNGNYLEARKLIEEGLQYARMANDQWFTAYGIYNLGHVDSLMGEYQKGYEQMKEGMKIWRDVGDPHSISLGLNFLVNTQIKLGLYEEAKASMRESIALCEQTRNRWGMGTAYRYLGLATMAGGEYTEAQVCFQKSLETFGEYFEGWDIAQSLIYLGDAVLMSNDLDRAGKIYLEALRLAKEAQSPPSIVDALAGLAFFNMSSGKYKQAWELSQLVLNHPSSVQEARDRAHQIEQEVATHLSDNQILALRADVSTMSLDDLANSLITHLN